MALLSVMSVRGTHLFFSVSSVFLVFKGGGRTDKTDRSLKIITGGKIMTDKTNKSTAFSDGIIGALGPYSQDQNVTTFTQETCNPILPPLHIRLQKLLDNIPLSAQHQGLSLLDLQACLRGRKGGLPHIGELAAAIRRLGWQRRRKWSDGDTAFSSKWYPKDANP